MTVACSLIIHNFASEAEVTANVIQQTTCTSISPCLFLLFVSADVRDMDDDELLLPREVRGAGTPQPADGFHRDAVAHVGFLLVNMVDEPRVS